MSNVIRWSTRCLMTKERERAPAGLVCELCSAASSSPSRVQVLGSRIASSGSLFGLFGNVGDAEAGIDGTYGTGSDEMRCSCATPLDQTRDTRAC